LRPPTPLQEARAFSMFLPNEVWYGAHDFTS